MSIIHHQRPFESPELSDQESHSFEYLSFFDLNLIMSGRSKFDFQLINRRGKIKDFLREDFEFLADEIDI
jgi:hypothetical protein